MTTPPMVGQPGLPPTTAPVTPGAVERVRIAAARAQSSNNLKQMALGFHNMHDSFDGISAAIRDKEGKPLLSWRVAILPYVEQDTLYKLFRLDEPWDGPNNKKLLEYMPKIYALPSVTKTGETTTYYRVFASNNRRMNTEPTIDAAFDLTRSVRFTDFSDGVSNTLLVGEAADAVPWTKPDELMFDPKSKTLPKLGAWHGNTGANASLADGSVHFFKKDLPADTLRALITRNGAEVAQLPY